MTNMWFIHSGKRASQWDDFRTSNRVAVGGSDGEDWSNKSLDDMKKQWPGHPHDVRTAQAISKNMKVGDVVVALGGSKKVKGIGIITSDYMPPTHSENTEHEYKHSRTVEWRILEECDIKTNKFPNIAITQKTKNNMGTWDEIKREYIAKNSDYKKIFAEIDPETPQPPELLPNPQLKPLHEAFTHTKNVILYGPPGTGKTYIAQQFIEEFLENRGETKSYYEFVTFHQSYGYEDFIEGLKPIVENNQVLYNIEAGVFKEFCNKARDDKDENSKYLFVIDEINRGNIAKIFGELITLIEDDKRNKIPTKLPYSKEDFTVPANVYILGTMNTADRSIALLDIALRRRFAFLELMPDSSLLKGGIDDLNVGDLLTELNKKVTDLLDREHQIGHSYFISVVQENDLEYAKKKLHFVWYRKIIPLLQEYFYNDWTQLEKVLGNFVTKIDSNYAIYPCEGDEFITRLKGIANNGAKSDIPEIDTKTEDNGDG